MHATIIYSRNGTIAFLPSGILSPNVRLYHASPLIALGVIFAAAFNANNHGGAISTFGQAAAGRYESAFSAQGLAASWDRTMCRAGTGRRKVCGRADSEGDGGGSAIRAKNVHSRLQHQLCPPSTC